MHSRVFLAATSLGLLACATKKPIAQESLLPLPRSSIAAVLDDRGELALTDAQIQQLMALDEELQRTDAPLRESLTRRKSDATGDGKLEGTTASGGHHGRGPGGTGMGGAHHRSTAVSTGGGQGQAEAAIQARIDENDTAAYMRAEEALSEPQRPRARAVASKYREDLADRRQAERAQRH